MCPAAEQHIHDWHGSIMPTTAFVSSQQGQLAALTTGYPLCHRSEVHLHADFPLLLI
jgi:hypothetical protein